MSVRLFILLAGICTSLPALADREQRLVALLTGEFNNHEQVWQRDLDKLTVIARQHWQFQSTDSNSTLSLATAEGQSAGTERWQFEFETIDRTEQGKGFAIESSISAMDSDNTGSKCRFLWEAHGEGYLGKPVKPRHCDRTLPSQIQIDSEILAITSGRGKSAAVYQARRVIRYSGWISLKRQHIEPDAADDDYIFVSDLSVHNEGFRIPIVDKSGSATGYTVELARLTYQRTQIAILKLGIIEEATGKTVSYAWAGPEAERVGINLRWVQAGMTKTP